MASPFDSDLLPDSAVDALMSATQGVLLGNDWVREQFQDRVLVSQVPIQDPLDLEYSGSAIIIAEEQWEPQGATSRSNYPAVTLLISVVFPADLFGYLSSEPDTRTSNRWLSLLFTLLSASESIKAASGGIPPKLLGHLTTRRSGDNGVSIAVAARVQTGTPRLTL